MSQSEIYADDEDLADFIVSDEAPHPDASGLGVPDKFSSSPKNHQNPHEPTRPDPTHPQTTADRLRDLGSTFSGNVPETSRLLRAHISILVSALGGPDHASENHVYKLGHDALACLKDLKRWLRAVDEKNGTFDVALACAECDLVKNDLTVILCQWDKPPKGIARTRTTDKIMLACLELLVLLTWPTEVNKNTLMKDYAAKTSNRRAQLVYKHHILAYKQGKTLKAVLRLGLNALKVPKEEREPRDINILRLILFFIRNVLYIEPLPTTKGPKAVANASALPNGLSADEIALPAVISAFDRNNVMLFLNSIAHSVSSDISDESFGLLVMECVSLLTRGVMIQELITFKSVTPDTTTSVPPASSVAGMNLSDLLGEENRRKKLANNSVSTRHGRFGTLLSIRNSNNDSYFAVSGQKALVSTYDTLEKLDNTKSWHKPSTFKYDSNAYAKKPSVVLGFKTAQILSSFINQLLTSGAFNNLLTFVGRHLTNLANDGDMGRRGILDAIDPTELSSYFLTIAWFFRYKRERTQTFTEGNKVPTDEEDGLDYGSVGAALSEVNFILLISYFRSSFEAKDYDSLHVAMVCFKEMLLISNTIFNKKRTQQEIDLESENDVNEDRELAEGIIRKLFSQKQFLDMCVNIPKTAAKHSPEYLGVVVSVVHILLKSFESLANEDVHLFIKTRRRMRKMEKRTGLNDEMDKEHWHLIDKGSDEEDNEDDIRYITQERKLDLRNTEVKFFHPETVSTHIEYLSKYEDLSSEEIKRGLSFFHRLFVVRKDYSALYRLDFMLLLYKLQAYLPRSSSNRRHVDDFIVYFMKKFKSALDRFPMAIELLFPRLENVETKGFLSTGDLEVYDSSEKNKEASVARGKSSYFDEDAVQPRAAPLLQFIDESQSVDAKIGILVYHLAKKKNTLAFLKFFSSELLRISELTRESPQLKLRLNLGNRRLLISDPHLRLLLETIGFGLPYLQNDETTLHASVSPESLKEARDCLNKWVELHTAGVGDIEPFLDQLQRMLVSKEQLDFGAEALADLRADKPYDEEKAAELELNERQIHKVIGLAKRKEYDESVSSQIYADDDFVDPPSDEDEDENDDGGDDEDREVHTQRWRRKRSRGRRHVDSDDDGDSDASLLDEPVPKKRRRRAKNGAPPSDVFSEDERPTRSAEMVHDSDDDSDEERNMAFFNKEEKLRQLISSTGGIASKEQLKMFKESWNTLLNSGGDDHVNEAVKLASGLFVGGSDDEEGSATTMTNQNTPVMTENVPSPVTSDEEESEDEEVPQEKDKEVPQDEDEEMSQDEDEEMSQDAENDNEERSISRKRRIIMDDEDDE
ncbi:hypothetical protein JCM33374_g2730 [Metschnikowia sp. JCM 33374]|nr:hypothetical protein JCM33374_g2730 [Metschnikowia sp. JCM 33374]